jgi:hypothetical protein
MRMAFKKVSIETKAVVRVPLIENETIAEKHPVNGKS